jgi:hypothetical protein
MLTPLQSYANSLGNSKHNVQSSRVEGLGVTIQSRYQDDAFVNAVRSSVTGELSRRIGAVKHQLAELGVTSFTKEQ